MKKIDMFQVKFVEEFPYSPEYGVLYISMEHSMAFHLCPCGCGHEIYIQFDPDLWTLKYDGHVSIYPSIGNFDIPCHSHYFINSDSVDWVKDDVTVKGKHKGKKKRYFQFVPKKLRRLFK